MRNLGQTLDFHWLSL